MTQDVLGFEFPEDTQFAMFSSLSAIYNLEAYPFPRWMIVMGGSTGGPALLACCWLLWRIFSLSGSLVPAR